MTQTLIESREEQPRAESKNTFDKQLIDVVVELYNAEKKPILNKKLAQKIRERSTHDLMKLYAQLNPNEKERHNKYLPNMFTPDIVEMANIAKAFVSEVTAIFTGSKKEKKPEPVESLTFPQIARVLEFYLFYLAKIEAKRNNEKSNHAGIQADRKDRIQQEVGKLVRYLELNIQSIY